MVDLQTQKNGPISSSVTPEDLEYQAAYHAAEAATRALLDRQGCETARAMRGVVIFLHRGLHALQTAGSQGAVPTLALAGYYLERAKAVQGVPDLLRGQALSSGQKAIDRMASIEEGREEVSGFVTSCFRSVEEICNSLLHRQ